MNKQSEHPVSIGIIMDGNRRWAKAKDLPTLEGHRMGYQKLKDVLLWSKEARITYLTVYAFSIENWNRSQEEVTYLMDLFRLMVGEMIKEALENDTRLIFFGDHSTLPSDIKEAIKDAEERTVKGSSFTLAIALSYGGRQEIVDAIHRIPKDEIATLSEEEFSRLLWTKDVPDPDLIIRTSGEQRLSNFLPWQSVYSELFFTETHWPDLSKEEFLSIIEGFGKRERRMGK